MTPDERRESQRQWARKYYRDNKERVADRIRKYHNSEKGRATRARYQAGPAFKASIRNWRYKKLYGITAAEYDALLLLQDGKCAICRRKSTSRLHVDHDHKTGTVRGLLCFSCNSRLGLLLEYQDWANAARAYLFESWKLQECQ